MEMFSLGSEMYKFISQVNWFSCMIVEWLMDFLCAA